MSPDPQPRWANDLAARIAEVSLLLQRWVDVNSFTGNVSGCNQVADLLCDAFAPLLPHVERRIGTGCGDHLAFASPAWFVPGVRRLLLIGHHDTVFPPGTFEGYRESEGRAFGPGVLDMKGGLSVIWAALSGLGPTCNLAELPVAVVSVSDEETGSVDSGRFLTEYARGSSAALVFEAGRVDDGIVVCRKGTGKISVDAKGRAAHAGNDLAAGRSAINALCELSLAVPSLVSHAGVTANVGVFRGGTSANTVAEHASCDIDLRFVDSGDGHAWLDALAKLAAEIAARTDVALTISGGVRRWAMQPTAESEALALSYARHAAAEGLGSGRAPLAGGGSDANTVATLGIPVIDGLGPRGRGFHTHDEFIELVTLGQRARALARFLAAWGEH